MPARRKASKTLDHSNEISAIATEGLSDREREAALGMRGAFLNQFVESHPEWSKALQQGSTGVDIAALENLFKLVTGDYEVVEEKYPVRNEDGAVIGTRKITRPGPNFQAVRLWLESRGAQSETAKVANSPNAESKQELISSILALVHPKPDHRTCLSTGTHYGTACRHRHAGRKDVYHDQRIFRLFEHRGYQRRCQPDPARR